MATANSSLVARRYAQAALELAIQHNNLDEWRRDMATLAAIWEQSRIALRLGDPKLGRARRVQEARELLKGRINNLALNLALLLVERGRAAMVPQVVQAFERLERERERRATAYVTSALPLTDVQRKNLQAALSLRTGLTIDLAETVDPAIIGGLIVRIGDELIDASVAGRLRRIEAQLSG